MRAPSGDQFIVTKEQKAAIASGFGGICYEIEGAAIAQVCHFNDTPFVVIRAISDRPDETEIVDCQAFEAQAAKRSATVVEHMVKSMG